VFEVDLTTDFEGDARDETSPDIGADELVAEEPESDIGKVAGVERGSIKNIAGVGIDDIKKVGGVENE